MTILNILYYPDKRLKKISKDVNKIENNINNIINNMIETMYHYNGIGLSATQVNIHKKIIVIDISKKKNNALIFINPIIIKKSGYISLSEGCLSIPNIFFKIPRYKNITIKALNHKGENIKLHADELLSVCIQHEIDHLNGILFIEYLSKNIQNKIKHIFNKK